jgi:hypothetical protein
MMSAPVTHYEMTLEEHRAERGSYVDPDRYKPGHRDFQPEMLCHTGDGHAVGTRNKAAVTCSACRRLMKEAHRCTVSGCCPPAPPQEEFTAFLLHDTLPNGWTRYQDGAISKQGDCGVTFVWQNGTVQSRLF